MSRFRALGFKVYGEVYPAFRTPLVVWGLYGENIGAMGVYRGYIGNIFESYWDHGKENGNYKDHRGSGSPA